MDPDMQLVAFCLTTIQLHAVHRYQYLLVGRILVRTAYICTVTLHRKTEPTCVLSCLQCPDVLAQRLDLDTLHQFAGYTTTVANAVDSAAVAKTLNSTAAVSKL